MEVKVKTADGGTEEFKTEEEVFTQVSKSLTERFRLAFTAKCHEGQLFDDIGFIGDTAAARQILAGTYVFPADTDPATMLLLEEAGHMFRSMPDKEVATYVTIKDYQY